MFRIEHLRTSVYHLQTEDLVERYNKTLKVLFKKVVGIDVPDWDLLLPYLLCTYTSIHGVLAIRVHGRLRRVENRRSGNQALSECDRAHGADAGLNGKYAHQ